MQIKAVTIFHVSLNMAVSICSVQADLVQRVLQCVKATLIESNRADNFKLELTEKLLMESSLRKYQFS